MNFEVELSRCKCLHLMSSRCEFTCHEFSYYKIFTQSLKFLILIVYDGEESRAVDKSEYLVIIRVNFC